jgi:N-acylneuraminate cytidylyltransferase
LAGEPLIDWTIGAALGAQRISHVVLTTPDEELIEYVRQKYGDRVFLIRRYRELAAFNTYIEDTMIHALEEVGRVHQLPNVLCLLYIEAPFRTSNHIDNAIDVLGLFDADTVVAVRPETDVIYQHDGCGLQPVRRSRSLRLERDDLLREVGRMHVIKREFLEKERQVVGGKVGHVVLDKTAAWRVSSDWDWELAEMMAQKIRKNQGS